MSQSTTTLRTVTATRYVTPLREGGSLPAIIEADDDGLYVMKFRGAGQGPKALIAELVAGEIGRALSLPVPEIVLVEMDPAMGRTEPDQEIQDLIRASAGLNLALDYLPGSISFDPVIDKVDSKLAGEIVWFDAYATNVDRTARNTNMLMWHGRLWLIDHGAALYFHHTWKDHLRRSRDSFAKIKEHVLLSSADALASADEEMAGRLAPQLIHRIVEMIPESWLAADLSFESVERQRAAYAQYLLKRLEGPRTFVEEAINARTMLV